jgi:NADH-quinone oxidoreductase subunit N
MSFDALPSKIAGLDQKAGLLFGIAMVIVGLGFKIGAVPMHIWIPDVYQGAPTPVTAFLSVGSKAAGFILLMRFLEACLTDSTSSHLSHLLVAITLATLILGNLAAIPQSNFKRLLAYSSIAHAGFMLLALAAGIGATDAGQGAGEIVSVYLATYLVMTLGVFFILAQIRIQRDGEDISHFDGLGKTNPLLAISLTILMASLAGLPLTAGFIGKFLVFKLAIEAGFWAGIAASIIGVAAGFYYYFKVIRAMWWSDLRDAQPVCIPRISAGCVAILTVATLVLGVWPQPVFWLLQAAH